MAGIVSEVRSTYQHLFYELADRRTIDWPLVTSPWTPIVIMTLYVLFVKKWGPQYMKDKPAFDLKFIINIYNVVQILACMYLVKNLVNYGWRRYRFLCEPIDYSENPQALQYVKLVYIYYLVKIVDLLDTVFIVLRKKEKQVTFLHVYHHSGMVMIGWMWTRYIAGGHGSLSGCINSFVHIWMYAYYFITSMWPTQRKNLWWKKYLTQLQIAQFVIIFIHSLVPLVSRNCNYPIFPCYIQMFQCTVFLCLFLNFYVKSYKVSKKLT